MLPRQKTEEIEKKYLAPYAQLSSMSLGRIFPEDECHFRPCYYRDLGRIIHSAAFRRLEYKTQVFVYHEGDYYRTRLTHTLEAAQMAQGMARIFNLNEDLAHAIALAHDLGHSPFGHPGEATLNKLMSDHGGFEHNAQSFRVVTEIEERYPNFRGLNLSYEVLEGLVKHSTAYDKPRLPKGFKDVGYPTLESQIVNFADEIAYMNHDLDDGLQCGLIKQEQLKDLSLWGSAYKIVERELKSSSEKIIKLKTISELINLLIDDLQRETKKRIAESGIKSIEDVRRIGKGIVGHSEKIGRDSHELKKFLFENLYTHPRVQEMTENAQRIINGLFSAYSNNTGLLPKELQGHIDNLNRPRLICDYIAGMTDRFAMQEYEKLFDSKKSL